ncbi:MAG: uracil-DNA glycosylase [Acidobacteriota bacterium]
MSQSDQRDQLAEHLKLFGEFGVVGVSRDPAWRRRGDVAPGPAATPATTAAPSAATVQADGETTVESLEMLRAEIGDCTRCKLHRLGRSHIVFGVGNPSADLMLVGEAPGHDEDLQGVPFVGRAGQLLTKIIEAIELTRDQVYIANVIKCRPPENRNPDPDEVETCEPFLFRQVQIIKPKVIVALGTFAAHTLLRSTEPISKLRGRFYRYGDAALLATFHPAYLLRSPDRKRDVWDDMKKVRAVLRGEAPDVSAQP